MFTSLSWHQTQDKRQWAWLQPQAYPSTDAHHRTRNFFLVPVASRKQRQTDIDLRYINMSVAVLQIVWLFLHKLQKSQSSHSERERLTTLEYCNTEQNQCQSPLGEPGKHSYDMENYVCCMPKYGHKQTAKKGHKTQRPTMNSAWQLAM